MTLALFGLGLNLLGAFTALILWQYTAWRVLPLLCCLSGVALQLYSGLTMSQITWAVNGSTEFWSAVGTLGLLEVAIFALIVASGQLDAVKTERTVKLIKEASGKMEPILGFFDYAADNRVSRKAFTELFRVLIRARPGGIRQKTVANVEAASAEAQALVRRDLADAFTKSIAVPTEANLEEELRERILTVTNFFERAYTLIKSKAINEPMFLGDQDYNIVAVYYTLEPTLACLMREEAFNFDNVTILANKAKPYLKQWLPSDHRLNTTPLFGPLDKLEEVETPC